MLVTPLSSSLRFSEAAALFHQSRATLDAGGRIGFMSPRTHKDLGVYLKTLGKFFGELRLSDIHPGHIASYQTARANGIGFTRKLGKREFATFAGAAKINDELSVLRRLLTAAGAWTPQLQALYLPLQEPDCDIPKALSEVEQERFLTTAASIRDCQPLWWYSLVALHTTFSSDEMRTIRQGDINLPQGILGVNRKHGKNRFRRREVPLTDAGCLWGAEQLLARSCDLVGRGPHLHLFPRRVKKNEYDGNRPMSPTGLRKQFEQVRVAAGVPWFRLNGWRHTAITRMAESAIPIAIIMRRAGHVSPRMTAHYTHISEAVERQAMIKMDIHRRAVAAVEQGCRQRA